MLFSEGTVFAFLPKCRGAVVCALCTFLGLVLLGSCNAISSIIHDEEVVARVGNDKLYFSEIRKIIPEYATPEDSAAFAQTYINSWAKDRLFASLAAKQLSAEELDVSVQLEEYRRSLLKYRYEQRYVNDRLDTLVSEKQVKDYYEKNKGSFILDRPVVKVVFVDIKKDARELDRLLDLMDSDDYADREEAAAIASTSALKFIDSSDEWMDILVLSREFGVPYKELMSMKKGTWIKYEPENRNELLAAYIPECVYSGPAPVEYCGGKIRDYILSARKHAIINDLEQDLLSDALEKKIFVIYQ